MGAKNNAEAALNPGSISLGPRGRHLSATMIET